jgi:hypothetical protein
MTETGIDRRQFVTVLAATLGLGACKAVPLPKMGEGPPAVGVKSAIRLGPAPIKGADAKFAFADVTGAPATHTIAFSQAINKEASLRKLNVVPEGDPTATYLVKGYLSAIGNSGGTLLVYVWDVTDTTGRRLHRVSGQEPGGGSSTDPWSGVNEDAVTNAATRTVDDLVAWVS